MAVHVIPCTEEELHTKSAECVCGPKFILDPETGEMVWAHDFLDLERLIDAMIL
jgi:hypothetical protein